MSKQTNSHYLSIFTPSQTDPKDLEAIFVQREGLLVDAIGRIVESVKTKNKQHQLIVGGRGSGKSHLVSLLVHRLSQKKIINKKLKIAWLNEDETCTTFLDILINTFDSLNKRYPDEFPLGEIQSVYDKKPAEAQIFLSELLVEKLKSSKQTCLIIIENLDSLFEYIGDKGQKQLRAYLQENPLFTLFSTAQKLTDDLKNRNDPFFGFFQTEHLKPLTEEQAADLIDKIAKLQNKKEVSDFINTDKGKMRIKALHHLSGGNHRVYLVLSQFISRDSIDSLVTPFLKMVDELTPYYQERLRWLPPVQRKIIETLSATRTTLSVKQIAKQLFSSNQTISSQLKELKDKGYVKSHKRGRESLYEMTEPLMRICVEVKDNQSNKPIAILVEFIRAWYDGRDLQDRLGKKKLSQLSKQYLNAAFERTVEVSVSYLKEKGFTMSGLKSDDLLSLADYTKTIESENALEEALRNALLGRAELFFYQENFELTVSDITQFLKMPDIPNEQVAHALFNRSLTYGKLGVMKKALVDYTQIISLTDVSVEQVAQTLLNRGVVYGQQGELKKELADYTQLIALPDASPEQVTRALFNRGATYYQKGNLEKAVADYTQLINLQNVPVELVANALFNRAIVYKNQNKIKKEIVDYTQLINLQGAPIESLAKALFYRGVAHGIQDNTKEEIADYTQLIILPDASVDQVASALINRGIIYGRENRIKKALSDFIEVISLKNLPPFLKVRAHLHSGIASIQLNEWSKAKRELKKGLLIDDYSEGFFTLGVLTAFYDTFVDRSIRQKNIAELLEIFKINKLALSELGSSLIEFLGRLFKRDSYLLKDNLVSWRDALGNAMQDIEGLGVTQRIFLVGMEFLLSDNDETVLLDLVESEREILRQTFQLNS